MTATAPLWLVLALGALTLLGSNTGTWLLNRRGAGDASALALAQTRQANEGAVAHRLPLRRSSYASRIGQAIAAALPL